MAQASIKRRGKEERKKLGQRKHTFGGRVARGKIYKLKKKKKKILPLLLAPLS
jgi:hypothetical protein